MTDAELITHLGGPSKVAQLLGFEKNGVQRVHNWIERGIPPSVKVERPDIFIIPFLPKKRSTPSTQGA
jgi:hypothetical protein